MTVRAHNRIQAAYLVIISFILLAGESSPARDETAAAEAVEWAIEEQVRIGSLDDPDAGFSQIDGMVKAADGLLYVLEGQDRQVRVYNGSGQLVRCLG